MIFPFILVFRGVGPRTSGNLQKDEGIVGRLATTRGDQGVLGNTYLPTLEPLPLPNLVVVMSMLET